MILVSCFLGILFIKVCGKSCYLPIWFVIKFRICLNYCMRGCYSGMAYIIDWLVMNALSTTSKFLNGRKFHSHVRFLRQARDDGSPLLDTKTYKYSMMVPRFWTPRLTNIRWWFPAFGHQDLQIFAFNWCPTVSYELHTAGFSFCC